MTDFNEIIADLKEMPEAELRQSIFSLDGLGPDPHHLFTHQLEALRRIELGAKQVPPVSGILHYPTGAGKTRVALELIARGLRQNPEHRFIWATARKNLLRQTMIRMAELSKLFPAETTFGWCKDADEVDNAQDDDVHVLFMTRRNLTTVLERAADRRRKNHSWRIHLERERPMTLIYDECHQLGAEKLQSVWRKFHEQVVSPSRREQRPWRTLGLSATPIPTQMTAHQLLGECVFPPRGPSTSHDWPFHFFHRVRNETLIQSGVLCGLNASFDASGYFDIPPQLLRKVTGEAHLTPPGPNADGWELQRYSTQFNGHVMSDGRILSFLAERIVSRLAELGKTIVFVPTIGAANQMAALLYERFPEVRGAVATVHSRMDQVRLPGQAKASVHEVLERFRQQEARPSILINVDMLTEGFDDPKIKTVVLARLTHSTNRFWQMIGRGTRGPACGGTTECNFIDPVKLVRLYDYFSGYQPAVRGGATVEFERGDDDDDTDAKDGTGLGLLSPEVPVGTRPPDPVGCPYALDPEVAKMHRQVAIALQHFLEGKSLSEVDALGASRCVRVDMSEGRPVLRTAEDGFEPATAMALLLGELGGLEARSGKDLNWFRRQLPAELDEALLVQRLRVLRAIEALSLWTETEYARAQTTGAFLQALQKEATTHHPGHAESKAASATVEATIDAAVTLIESDGGAHPLSYVERFIIVDSLRVLFGTSPTEALDAALRCRTAPQKVPFDRLEQSLSNEQKQQFLRQMAELASAAGTVSPARQTMLAGFGARLGIPANIAGSIVGTDPDLKDSAAPASGVACSSCAFDMPTGASFCPACGTRARAA